LYGSKWKSISLSGHAMYMYIETNNDYKPNWLRTAQWWPRFI